MINVGTGEDITIKEFAACVADVVGYEGEIVLITLVRMARRRSFLTSRS
jgi:nucleoside-diphosphate-sugar epimerase